MKVERIKINDIKQVENTRGSTDRDLPQLMNSIQQHGLQQPIGVEYKGNGSYKIMYGNRRLNACMKLGWTSIPAVLYSDQEDSSFLIHNLVENLQRQAVSPSEVGRICFKLKDTHGLTTPEIAARLNMKETMVKSVMDMYSNFPATLRDKVTFHQSGAKRKGSLNVTNVTKALTLRNKLGLSRAGIRKIMKHVQLDSLSNEDIQVIGSLMESGITYSKAITLRKNYRVYRLSILALEDEVNDLAKKNNCSPISYLTQSIYGLQNPISKPSFIKVGIGKKSTKV